MKKFIIPMFMAILLAFYGASFAAEVSPIPISAEQAFDSVQTQTDPITGLSTSVVLIDVRTRAEYFWVGAVCQVDEIILNDGTSIEPNYGKVKLNENGDLVLNGGIEIAVSDVSNINLSPIAISIPYKLWNEKKGTLYFNNKFRKKVETLADDYDVLIFFCRSGGRSEDCLGGFDTKLFEEIYEVDQPDGKSGRGGFEGTSYGNVYNGYRGYPGRFTDEQEHPSVSWKDAGLPIKTSVNPLQ